MIPVPPSGTRLRLGLMVAGKGDRHANCYRYDECLGAAARSAGKAHCPTDCDTRSDVTREELLAEAIVGRCRSPLADMQDQETPMEALQPPKRHDVPNPNAKRRRPIAPAVLAALIDGPLSTLALAKATGFPRYSLSGRLSDMARMGLVRRVGAVRVHEKTGARTVIWEAA